ncbi:hypothetical protein OG946_00225 [Streptomyces sp. NBC_01808]|nr:hypothetical protein [Streptomyces sp. NBC_01808]WSA35936.1 hypothetical protein OG946_00225 [Streptomyces sp. NBC_01808]
MPWVTLASAVVGALIATVSAALLDQGIAVQVIMFGTHCEPCGYNAGH